MIVRCGANLVSVLSNPGYERWNLVGFLVSLLAMYLRPLCNRSLSLHNRPFDVCDDSKRLRNCNRKVKRSSALLKVVLASEHLTHNW